MRNYVKRLSKEIYGLSIDEAHRQGVCIQCKEKAIPKCYSNAGYREYKISGLCEKCFDEITMGGD